MSEFNGSIAQVNVQFPIETVIEPIAGENYSRAMIFMHETFASENLPNVNNPKAGMKIELDSSSYANITGGLLKKWLVPFFTSAQTAKLAVVLYDSDYTREIPVYSYSEYSETLEPTDNPHDLGLYELNDNVYTLTADTTPTEGKTYYTRTQTGTQTETTPATFSLETAYEHYKYYAYFKFGFSNMENYVSLQKQLATLCKADSLYSDLWVGTSDTHVLEKTSTLISELNSIDSNARVIYNPNAEINPALAQLGDTLGAVNSTGTPIGNDIDGHAFGTIGASGKLDDDGYYLNLSATEKAVLDEQKIGYQTWVGDGTENVVTEGSLSLKGEVVGANWVKHYIEYVCKIKSASYMTRRNKFRNNSEYQAVLTILAGVVKPFVDFGRLADFILTAPTFSQLPKSADSFTVPNAWEATYIDRIRNITVYGTLYVTQPTK